MKHQATELELHPAQTAALHILLFQPDAGFSELNTSGITSDHFNFHLQRLQEAGLIAKLDSGRYTLTVAGKEFANRYDTENRVVERQAKVTLVLLISKEVDGETFHLVQKRLKQPYFGFYGKPTGKIKWGEEVLEAAARELLEETGLSAELSLVGVEHKLDQDPAGQLLEDKYFFIVQGLNPRGDFTEKFEGGENYWMTKQEMAALPQSFGNFTAFLDTVQEKQLSYREWRYIAETY